MIEFDYNKGRRVGVLKTDKDTLNFIRNHFSIKNEGAYFARKKGYKFVSDRKYIITPTGRFPFGLYYEIRKFLIEKQITEIYYSDSFKERLKCGFETFSYWDELKYEPRYFQKETVENGLKFGCGTVLIGTGGGKSRTQACLIENFLRHSEGDLKCLLIVPGIGLVNQMLNDFEEYGVTFAFSGWTGDMDLQDTQVVVANIENINAKFKDHPWIKDVDLFIQDEGHKINKSSNITNHIKKIKTPHKFAFTGSLSDDCFDRWTCIGTFGPVIYDKNSKELRDEKFLSDVKASMVQMMYDSVPRLTYNQELQKIYNCPKRNDKIKRLCLNLKGNSLLLVNHIDYGERLLEIMKNNGKDVFFVQGSVEVEDRKKIINYMEENDNVICIAISSIFSTGINIKNLHNIVLVSGGKAFIRLVQSIGRGLRLHESKNVLNIIDVYDNLKYSSKHAERRKEIYEEQQIPFKEVKINL